MKRNIYALRIEPERIVAAEVDDDAVAVLFDKGNPIFLATRGELAALARRQQKSLVVLHYQGAVFVDVRRNDLEPRPPRLGPQRGPAFARRPAQGIAWAPTPEVDAGNLAGLGR